MKKLGDYATVEEAVEITGYSNIHLRRLIKSEKLEAIKLGSVWLISRDSLASYRAESEVRRKEDGRYGPRGY